MSSAVKQKAREADEMIAKLAEQSRRPADAEPPAAPVDDAPLAAEAEQDAPPNQQSDQQPVASATPAAPAPQDNTGELREQLRVWEARYSSLEGMIRARDKQIDQYQTMLANIQSQPAQQAAPANQSQELVTKEEEQVFGKDMVDFVQRLAQHEASKVVTALERKFQQIEEKLLGITNTTQAVAHDTFEAKLAREIDNFHEIDANPAFERWIKERKSRHHLFGTAVQSQDVDTLADIYTEFARLHLIKPQAEQTGAVAAPAQQQAAPSKPTLEQQVAPGKGRTTTPAASPASNDEKVWTRSEIAALYNRKRDYKPEEFTKLEREVFAAQQNGRVDYTR